MCNVVLIAFDDSTTNSAPQVSCYDGPTPASGLRAVAGGTMEPLSQSFNFSVPCSAIPQSGELQYGPLYSPPTYTGDALSRFTPAVSYWPTTVPVGLTGVQRASDFTRHQYPLHVVSFFCMVNSQ